MFAKIKALGWPGPQISLVTILFLMWGHEPKTYKHHFEGEIPRFIVEKAALVEPGKKLIAENEKIKLIET